MAPSRKRRESVDPAPRRPTPSPGPAPEALVAGSGVRRHDAEAAQPAAPDPSDTMRRGYARGRERDEAIRANLVPLAPGERPLPLTISAVVAALIALANAVLYLTGYQLSGNASSASGSDAPAISTFVFVALMGAAAIGMWRRSYWAVLGFQAVLAITILFGSLGLIQAANLRGALLALAAVLGAGTLFWFLIRSMARIQATERMDAIEEEAMAALERHRTLDAARDEALRSAARPDPS